VTVSTDKVSLSHLLIPRYIAYLRTSIDLLRNMAIRTYISGLSVPDFGERETPEPLLVPLQKVSWIVAVYAVLVQQGAILSSPVLANLSAGLGIADAQANVFNTLAIAINIAFVGLLCAFRARRLLTLILGNKTAVALTLLIFISVAWSIHPDVTLRRGVNYFSTLLTAFYLAAFFDLDEIMKIISSSIAIAVVSSFILVFAFPLDAIHQSSQWQIDDITGAWKGAFSHKNVLGHVMTVGVIVELYILTATRSRLLWHISILFGCLTLIFFARSGTAILLTALYTIGAILFVILQRAREYFGVALAMLATIAITVAVIYLAYPDLVFAALGSDATLTGRTELWALVLNLIDERPTLGWGYSAMWLPDDSLTKTISHTVGWSVPQAHNAFLEVALELGVVGLTVVITFVAISFWRATRCLLAERYRFGMFSLAFFIGIIVSGLTESTLAQNQTIEWLMFNVLSFCCGLQIVQSGESADPYLSGPYADRLAGESPRRLA
jgi:exopolysaccharide production protein ExoQ